MTTKYCKYDIKNWLNQIYNWMKDQGKTEYALHDLPEYLQHSGYHLSAARCELIEATGKTINWNRKPQKVWKLKMRYVSDWQREKAKELLAAGKTPTAVARSVAMSANTIRKELC